MGCGPSKSRVDTLIAEAVETNHEGRIRQYAFDSENAENSDIDQLSARPKSSMTVTVRSANELPLVTTSFENHWTTARHSLDTVLPAADDQVTKRGKSTGPTGPLGWRIWKTTRERQDFITAALIVLSGNGFRNISRSQIKLHFTRLGMQRMAYRASLTVMYDPDDGYHSEAMVAHGLVTRQFAVDQRTAFMELIFDVEEMLESHLLNGETHISKHGIGIGQRELESQIRSRTIKRIELPFVPSDAAQAMNGLGEPYLYNRSIEAQPPSTTKSSSDYGGFVVGEVGTKKSAPSCRTTGGVGAMPYNTWMQPMPSRARQMYSDVPARLSLASMN